MGKTIRLIMAFLILIGFIKRGDICAFFGKIAYQKGNEEKCLKWVERGAKIGNMSFNNKLLHGYLVLRSGDTERANKLFNLLGMERLNFNQKMKLKSNKALCTWKMGDIDGAIEQYEEVIKEAPTTTVYGSLGYLYILNNQFEKALEFNKEAYDYNSDNNNILDNLANSYLKLKDYENAEKYYKMLFERNPDFSECYFEYGKYLFEKGNEEGVEYIKKALSCKFSPLSPVTRHNIIMYMENHNIK